MLVANFLVAVVSLPAGCFNPYSGVKTSILILNKSLARQSSTIGFFKVEKDGFGLGAQRRAIDKNDLPQVKGELRSYLQALGTRQSITEPQSTCGLIVLKEKIAANGDYNLSAERYRDAVAIMGHYPTQMLGELLEIQSGFPFKSELFSEESGFPIIRIRDIKPNRTVTKYSGEYDPSFVVQNGDLLIGMDGEFNSVIWNGGPALLNQRVSRLHSFRGCLKEYVALLIPKKLREIEDGTYAVTVKHISGKQISAIEIPLPPLEVQKEIVAEIEAYQKVINGARAVLDHYRPHIPIHPDWPMVELGTISNIVRGSSPRPQGDPALFGGPIPRLMVADITRDGMYVTPQIDSLTEEGASKSRPMKKGDVIITVSGNPGLPTILATDACIHDGFVGLRELRHDVLPEYLYFALLALHASHGSQSVGAVFKNLTTDQIREFKIALPPLETQHAIVAEIEADQALVAANRKLIERVERKIQATLARVWGEDRPGFPEP
jgi:type I restriction enzyme M protein